MKHWGNIKKNEIDFLLILEKLLHLIKEKSKVTNNEDIIPFFFFFFPRGAIYGYMCTK